MLEKEKMEMQNNNLSSPLPYFLSVLKKISFKHQHESQDGHVVELERRNTLNKNSLRMLDLFSSKSKRVEDKKANNYLIQEAIHDEKMRLVELESKYQSLSSEHRSKQRVLQQEEALIIKNLKVLRKKL